MKHHSLLSPRFALSVTLLVCAAAATTACGDSGELSEADFAFEPSDLDTEIVGNWVGTLVDDAGTEETFSLDLLRSGAQTTESIDDTLTSRLQCGSVSRTAGTSFGIACMDMYETRLNLAGTLESDDSFSNRIAVEASYSVLGKELPAYNRTVVIALPQGAQLVGTRDDADNFTGEWTQRGSTAFGSFTMSRAAADEE